jgi:hypothetical protein
MQITQHWPPMPNSMQICAIAKLVDVADQSPCRQPFYSGTGDCSSGMSIYLACFGFGILCSVASLEYIDVDNENSNLNRDRSLRK